MGKTVLIVEDRPANMERLVAIVLAAFPGSSITSAGNVAGGVSHLRGDTVFELIIIDLGLPDGSGLDLIKEARSRTPDSYVVVATIFDDNEHLLSSLRYGASGYLLKDDSEERLIGQLQGIVNNRPPISDRALDQILNHLQEMPGGNDAAELTAREQEVLQLVAKGYSVNKAAEMLGLRTNTVKSYLKAVYAKLGISSRAEATAEAIKRQLIEV